VVTFVFTGNIEGSTRRWEADANAMRAALLVHDQVLRSSSIDAPAAERISPLMTAEQQRCRVQVERLKNIGSQLLMSGARALLHYRTVAIGPTPENERYRMPVQNMAWNWIGGYGGDDGGSASIQVNFAPAMAVAQCSLSIADGDALVAGGITQYVTRTEPAGPDQDHNFSIVGDTYWLPPMAYDPLMTSVTAELDLAINKARCC
jgi:hypothetical protein